MFPNSAMPFTFTTPPDSWKPSHRTPIKPRGPAFTPSKPSFSSSSDPHSAWRRRFRQQCLDRAKHERDEIVRRRRGVSEDVGSSDGWDEGDVGGMDVDREEGDSKAREREEEQHMIDRILREEWASFRHQYLESTGSEADPDFAAALYEQDQLDAERDGLFYTTLQADLESELVGGGTEAEQEEPPPDAYDDTDMDEMAFIEDMVATHLGSY
ncbi:hypothetical protein HDU93_000334 [Gonapodya sp. JEL0774]|nr:hypothetical protein HDU93_000334 [Gonapodya sp. JEL0774]